MSQELQVTGSIVFQKGNSGPLAKAIVGLLIDVSGNNCVYEAGLSIATSETTIQLGGLTAPFGWALFHNIDATNTINIKTGASGTIFCSLLPGEFALLRLGSGISAPVAVSSADTPKLEYVILQP